MSAAFRPSRELGSPTSTRIVFPAAATVRQGTSAREPRTTEHPVTANSSWILSSPSIGAPRIKKPGEPGNRRACSHAPCMRPGSARVFAGSYSAGGTGARNAKSPRNGGLLAVKLSILARLTAVVAVNLHLLGSFSGSPIGLLHRGATWPHVVKPTAIERACQAYSKHPTIHSAPSSLPSTTLLWSCARKCWL